MNVFDFISLFGGLALFLYGMRLMGDGLQQGSSGALKKFMEKVANNPLTGFAGASGDGYHPEFDSHHRPRPPAWSARASCTLQPVHRHHPRRERRHHGHRARSSVCSTSNARRQFLVAEYLQALNPGPARGHPRHPADHGPPHSSNSDTIGTVAMGFGILFTGLLNMTAAVAPLSAVSRRLRSLFVRHGRHPAARLSRRCAGVGVLRSRAPRPPSAFYRRLSVTGAA